MEYRFSVSEIVSAFKCPMHFFLKRRGKNAFFYYAGNENLGTFVHYVLSNFAISLKKQTLFHEKFSVCREMKKSFIDVSFSWKGKVDFEKAWNYLESISAYFNFITRGKSKDEIAKMFVHSEKSFVIPMEGANISGKFDILLKREGKFEIIDYKTRRSEIDFDGIQITLYKYAVEKLFGEKAIPVIISISEKEIRTEKFTDEEYRELLNVIYSKIREMKEILEGTLLPEQAAEKEICKHCSLRYNCERFSREVVYEK